jgi:hypothetical protein
VRNLVTIALLGVLLLPGGSSARATWALSGLWRDNSGNPYQLKQMGNTLNWEAHSSDNRTWGHKYSGRIAADDTFTGRYSDQPDYSRQLHGTISGTIVDSCHIDLLLTVDENGARLRGSLTRPCPAVTAPKVDAITSYGPWSSKIKLRFRVTDNQGEVKVRAVIYDGRKPIRSYMTRRASANGANDAYWYYLPPRTLRREANLVFCVTATNDAGKSGRDCAALYVNKP